LVLFFKFLVFFLVFFWVAGDIIIRAREITDQFVDRFAAMSRGRSKRRGESERSAIVRGREQEATVRHYVSSDLRIIIKRHLACMFPSRVLQSLRNRMLTALELFFAGLPFGAITDSLVGLVGVTSESAGAKNKDSDPAILAKIASVLKSQFKRARSRTLPGSTTEVNPNRMAIEMHVVNSFFLSGPAIVMVKSMSPSLFWVTEDQFRLFTMEELLGATLFSRALRDRPESILEFLHVVLQRVYAIQNRLNSIQQASLIDVLRYKLRDMNYNFAVDVREAKAAQPERSLFVAREAVQSRVNPKSVKWKFLDGKWVCLEESG
jgi:hypothetical protein